jgi:hypothetical protein
MKSRQEFRSVKGPLRCGGPRRLGSFLGIYWPGRFKTIVDEVNDGQERRELKKDLDEFERDFLALAKVGPAASQSIGRLIAGAALFGTYADKEARAEFRVMQAAHARAAKHGRDTGRWQELDSAIRAEARAQKRALATSKELAELIRPGVCERLVVECSADNWPSWSTIKNAISRLKKQDRT